MEYHVAENIEKLINFKDDTISAKVLLKNCDSMAMIVAIKKNQLMPEHTSPVDALLYVLEGEVEFQVKECQFENFKINKGEIFTIKANEKHCVLGKKDSKFLVIRI